VSTVSDKARLVYSVIVILLLDRSKSRFQKI